MKIGDKVWPSKSCRKRYWYPEVENYGWPGTVEGLQWCNVRKCHVVTFKIDRGNGKAFRCKWSILNLEVYRLTLENK